LAILWASALLCQPESGRTKYTFLDLGLGRTKSCVSHRPFLRTDNRCIMPCPLLCVSSRNITRTGCKGKYAHLPCFNPYAACHLHLCTMCVLCSCSLSRRGDTAPSFLPSFSVREIANRQITMTHVFYSHTSDRGG